MTNERATHEWSVTAQQQTTGQDASGAYVRGINVTFSTPTGLGATLFIPETQYNAETVRIAIENRLRAMADVHALGGSI